MSKLKVKQTYYNKCLFSDHVICYTLRDTNVNPDITDEDIARMSWNVGQIESEWCEDCNKKTAQQRVAYSLEQL